MHQNGPPHRPNYSVKEVDGIYLDADEEVRYSVGQHIFGLFILYFMVIAGLVAAAVLLSLLVPDFVSGTAKDLAFIGSASVLALILVAIFLAVATYLYKQSRLTITNKHVIQVMQYGLFHRKISQISMGNVEDVTADQKGIFATMFNYGTLKVETAGEQKNFIFRYCPKPAMFAQVVHDEREVFMRGESKEAIAEEQL